ncbi:MAG: hypothetical protein ACTS4Z_01645 [Candidatus Hodgkinia cicadicola]
MRRIQLRRDEECPPLCDKPKDGGMNGRNKVKEVCNQVPKRRAGTWICNTETSRDEVQLCSNF